MSHAAYFDMPIAGDAEPRRIGRPNALAFSLAAAVVATCLSGASVVYALSHIPEVDPGAGPAPVVAMATTARTKLEVLSPPVHGPDLVRAAPAVAYAVPLRAQTTMNATDLAKLAHTDGVAVDGVTRDCTDPCSAQAGYIAPDAANEDAPAVAADDDQANDPAPIEAQGAPSTDSSGN